MTSTMEEVLRFVEENDVKFIRLSFCDLFGIQKNISIMPSELPRAFAHGIGFDASAVPGFGGGAQSDLLLIPDPGTLSILPWRPAQGRVIRFFCDIQNPDGTPYALDGRQILRRAVQKCAGMGYVCRVGAECEFYLFLTDEAGNPTDTPMDRGGYCDIAPADKGENVRREICLTLEQMGIQPESSHHEQGPGQNEIDFKYADALSAADSLIHFKSAVKVIAERNGLYASFLPKPLPDSSGSGLHVNLSLAKDGRNIFHVDTREHSQQAESFIAGVLDRAAECTAFFNPLDNSYSRLGRMQAPRFVTWSHQNRSQLIRIPAAPPQRGRMELRSPDPACNPYLAYALIMQAGLEGIARNLPLPAPNNSDLSRPDERAAGLDRLPGSLPEAVDLARRSVFIRSCLPQELIDRYLDRKAAQAQRTARAEDPERDARDRYFDQI